MRRHRTRTVILVAMIALTMAATAVAKQPEGKGKPAPSIVGMTCADYYGDDVILVDGKTGGFGLSIADKGSTCVDVVNVPTGTWIVDVNVGSAREVTVQLRSSVPGDWCWVESTKEDQIFTFENTPASVEDACDWMLGAGGESIPDYDPALAFTAYYSGKKVLETPVVITVTLPLP